jgi:hypothetical protein
MFLNYLPLWRQGWLLAPFVFDVLPL